MAVAGHQSMGIVHHASSPELMMHALDNVHSLFSNSLFLANKKVRCIATHAQKHLVLSALCSRPDQHASREEKRYLSLNTRKAPASPTKVEEVKSHQHCKKAIARKKAKSTPHATPCSCK
jgi:hypothetical protein